MNFTISNCVHKSVSICALSYKVSFSTDSLRTLIVLAHHNQWKHLPAQKYLDNRINIQCIPMILLDEIVESSVIVGIGSDCGAALCSIRGLANYGSFPSHSSLLEIVFLYFPSTYPNPFTLSSVECNDLIISSVKCNPLTLYSILHLPLNLFP